MSERKRTNVEIDLLNQFLKEGETPLPYELDENNNPINNNPIEAIISDEEKLSTEQKVDEGQEGKEQTPDKKEISAAIEVELDDEKVLAYIKNKKGKDVTSLDEFLNPKKELSEEDKKKLADQRDANKIAYGLSNGMFTEKELKSFIIDTENPKDLVYASYLADQKAKDAELTDDEIEEEFNEKFGLNQKEDTRQYKAGQTLISNIANNLIRQKHSKILNLDNAFNSYETTQASQKEIEAKILTQAPLYKKDIEQIRGEIKKVSIPISKDEVFEIELDDEIVDGTISELLDNQYSETQIKNGWNKDAIKQVAQTSGIIKQLPKIIKAYADKQLLDRQAGLRGILPNGKQSGREQAKELTEDQKKALAFAFPDQPAIAN